MWHSQMANQTGQLLKKIFFLIWCLVQKVTKWLLCDQMTAKLSLFMPYFQEAHQTKQLLQNKLFNMMFNLKSDEMTAVWPNDS